MIPAFHKDSLSISLMHNTLPDCIGSALAARCVCLCPDGVDTTKVLIRGFELYVTIFG